MTVLYIPGLGSDRTLAAQRMYVSFLNRFKRSNNHLHFFNPQWESDESSEAKYGRLENAYAASGQPKRIWAISAGAALAVHLAAEHLEIKRVDLICGKVSGSKKITEKYSSRAPAFVESVQKSEACLKSPNLNGSRFVSYVPLGPDDGVLERIDMLVPSGQVVNLPRLRHAYAIGYSLLRYLPLTN